MVAAMPFGARMVSRGWALNLRVDDLDGIVEALRASGVDVEVEVDATAYDHGRFAELADPEGNPLQLWEPPR